MSWRPSWMSESGQETLPDVWDWSGDLSKCPGGSPECLGVVGRPFRMSKSGRETLLNV